ncbi:unnamed protein product [Prorocentrum cordatum]|uniref:Uncharacterized protein n=1 Tax=Prorocentrum cordatum TaxID=2364126 RepID=A0ABN9QWE8_9DINO|nr:unnamed protein product [Polarella glacialis]
MPGAPRRSPAPVRLAALVAGGLLLRAALAPTCFVGGAATSARRGGLAPQRAEAEKPEAAAEEFVAINEDNTAAMAIVCSSVIGGITGVLVGGPVLGVLLFVGFAFLVRQGADNDAATALKGVAAKGLETLNFIGGVDQKYEVTRKVGKSVGEQVDKVKASSPEAAEIIDKVGGAIEKVDKEVNIKSSLSNVVTSGSSLAKDIVDKAIETNEKYGISDKIKGTIGDAVSKVQKKE